MVSPSAPSSPKWYRLDEDLARYAGQLLRLGPGPVGRGGALVALGDVVP